MIDISRDYSLLPHNTFGIDVKTKIWVEYDTEDDLKELLQQPFMQEQPLLHVGMGSNLLFTQDYDGVILHSRIGGIEIINEDGNNVEVQIGSGVVWDDFCQWAINQGLYGTENLSGIPGECGAAAVQNIGAYGREVSDIIKKVKAIDTKTGKERFFAHKECSYAYRSSIFKTSREYNRYIVTQVIIQLQREGSLHLDYGNLHEALKEKAHPTMSDVREAVIAIRNSKLPDPKILGNAGSFFINPIVKRSKIDELLSVYPFMPHYIIDKNLGKIPAGWLIEQCGWKGRTIGGAGVYEKQCLVLVNRGNASPEDIINLSKAIVRTIDERFGIVISPEVNFIE